MLITHGATKIRIMIIALIIALLFGGFQDYILIPNMHKHLKKNIDHKETVHFVKSLVKDVNKEKKEFDKEQGKNWKQFEKSRSTNVLYYQVYIAEIKGGRSDLQIVQKEARKNIVAILTEDQWNNIFKSASKEFKRAEKTYLRSSKKLDKQFVKLENAIKKEVKQESRQGELLRITSDFKKELNKGIKNQSQLYFDNQKYWKYDASPETINTTISQANEIKYAYLDLFVETRIKILENTSKEEQKKIFRHLNKLF